MPIAFYLAAGVIVITGIAHTVLSAVIDKVRDAANNNPSRLRGVTVQEALEKVAHWEQTRKRLWPSALFVAGGFALFGLFSVAGQ